MRVSWEQCLLPCPCGRFELPRFVDWELRGPSFEQAFTERPEVEFWTGVAGLARLFDGERAVKEPALAGYLQEVSSGEQRGEVFRGNDPGAFVTAEG